MIYREYNLTYGFTAESGLSEEFHKHFLTIGRVYSFIEKYFKSHQWVEKDKIKFTVEIVLVERE